MYRWFIGAILIIMAMSCSDNEKEYFWPIQPMDTVNIVNKDGYYYNENGEKIFLDTIGGRSFVVIPIEVFLDIRNVENKIPVVFWVTIEPAKYNQMKGLIVSDSLHHCDTVYYKSQIYKSVEKDGGAMVFSNEIYVYLNSEREIDKLIDVAEYFNATIKEQKEIDGDYICVLDYYNGFYGISSVSVANYIHETNLFKRAVALKYILPLDF